MQALEFLDLLGTPWDVQNCAEIAHVALDRLGCPVPASALPTSIESGRAALAALAGSESPWRRVGEDWRACEQPGRVVLSASEDGGPHVGVVVAPRLVLSSCRLQGCYIAPASRVAGIQGVYEYR